ncbi:nucleoside-diphosphate sugar epimerase [Vibrio owensii]|uniref:NAD(P)H-binding protein n=1 Tax=Vibrio TaxID=662 RepID=UPI00028EEB0B|nr:MULTISPECIES: NAD(P)H-binding protein [Vibrio]AYO20246.1 NAD-dependent epimerase/dehydratase family protein [Vibrio owensii]EKM25078.1 pyridine nucleotide-disulfide oxidoreductase family protein [Vibrio sp. HENC-03]CAD7810988.1 COG0451 Nucleoside-diphosphate-sugar epimerases [Vibrio sp. B1ASS3]CAE6913675.1 COG0451 Nucleoside-diphosphate-sugar epimerases [Vibrio sp. B1ASS3]CAH1535332.1 Pyridine nucleotide-disulfide oxidoreductase family protein [Vibrio owensii]
MANTLIVGAGWLGTPLAQTLIDQGHQVTVTRRSQTRLDEFPLTSVQPALLDLNEPHSQQQLIELIEQHQIERIVGAFPPGFRKGNGQEYAQQWQRLVSAAKQSSVNKLLMVSSTTVYPNLAVDMKEEDATLALAQTSEHFSDNARIMLQAEQYVIDSGIDYAIVRCSGLIGSDRHPSRFAMRLKQVSRKAPANMVHQNDAVAATAFALNQIDNEVVNATTPNTVSKAEFYQAAITQSDLDIALPPVTETADKRILADKLVALGYQFQFNSTLDAL